MNISEIIDSLHPLEKKVLLYFQQVPILLSVPLKKLVDSQVIDPSQIEMVLGWLHSKQICEVIVTGSRKFASLTPLGETYAKSEIPEIRIFSRINQTPTTIKEIQTSAEFEPEEKSSAIGALKESGLIQIGPGGVLQVKNRDVLAQFNKIQDLLKKLLEKEGRCPIQELSEVEKMIAEEYSHKRGKSKGLIRIDEEVEREIVVTPALGKKILSSLSNEQTEVTYSQLTPEMLKDGSWRNQAPRKYNIHLRPSRIAIGKKHPYRQFLDLLKSKLVGLGFMEMRGELVETEFWNNDALFMPQFHPARDIHDVYFVKEPLFAKSIGQPFLNQVSEVHKDGWKTGSRGWRYDFDQERAKRLILRSQGTAVSSRTLASKPEIPGKYFSIARCFRYDQVDATHASDFFQVEGIVLGETIHFKTLLGLLTLFAKEVAKATEVKFLPAYFPFTEPSVEVHVKHPQLGWMELGGAGLFRPEVTLPLGVKVPVIAWGLGLDRMAMMALDIQDIRDLFSPDLELVRSKKVSV
ncbi:MAG: phenylalanine--tRNA ligase subunit alpha [Nitrospirae bacterium]|nr:phenylalanine--tRNA ligase subunit alpha [Nitrospirota bacterium]MBI3595327.1 phenylalanine--tRNA ligase subunit alpha [Nitrospirota bacterium]